MKKIVRSLLMLVTLFIVGSAVTPVMQAQPRHYRHHRHYHRHWHHR